MTRPNFFLGGLVAMMLVAAAQLLPTGFVAASGDRAAKPVAKAPAAAMTPTSAIDDLAAWPIAAGR